MTGSVSWQLERWIERARAAAARNDYQSANSAWRNVLIIDPDNAEAKAHLESSGSAVKAAAKQASTRPSRHPSTPPPHSSDRPSAPPSNLPRRPSGLPPRPLESGTFNRTQLLEHVRERRYEAALEILYDAQKINGTDAEITRSIALLRRRLLSSYTQEVGGLEMVPMKTGLAQKLGEDSNSVIGLVDGLATIEHIIELSPLSKLRSLKALSSMVKLGVIALRTETVLGKTDAMTEEKADSQSTQRGRDRRRSRSPRHATTLSFESPVTKDEDRSAG